MFDNTNSNTKKDEVVRFTLRIDKNLFEATQKSAQHNRRATGKEIEYALFRYYENLGILKNE